MPIPHSTSPIAILRGIQPDEVLTHIDILHNAGFTAVEIPLNSPEWQSSIQKAINEFGGKIRIGAGTVTEIANVSTLAALGCQFILTPNTNPAVIRAARSQGIDVCAGCMTVSEAFIALQAGATSLKIFPASILGPAYIRALLAVLPVNTSIYAVGGITPNNLADYLNAGCTGAGLGSDLYRAGQAPEVTKANGLEFIARWHAALA